MTQKDAVNSGRERLWFSPHCIRPGNDDNALLDYAEMELEPEEINNDD